MTDAQAQERREEDSFRQRVAANMQGASEGSDTPSRIPLRRVRGSRLNRPRGSQEMVEPRREFLRLAPLRRSTVPDFRPVFSWTVGNTQATGDQAPAHRPPRIVPGGSSSRSKGTAGSLERTGP